MTQVMPRPVIPEMEHLRDAITRYDHQLPEGTEEIDLLASIALAARGAVRLYDTQLAEYDLQVAQTPEDIAANIERQLGLAPGSIKRREEQGGEHRHRDH